MTRDNQIRFWLIGLAVFCLVLWLLRDILLPFVAGMAVAYLLDPAADRLEKWGLSRALATAIITVLFVLVVIAALLLFVPLLVQQIEAFSLRLPGYVENLRSLIAAMLEVLRDRVSPEDLERIRSAAGDFVGRGVDWLAGLLGGVVRGGVAVFSFLSLIFVTPVVAFYLLLDWDRMVDQVDGWLPREHAGTIRAQVLEIDRRLAGFVRGQTTVVIFLGLFYAIALSVAGLEFGLVVGLGAGLVSFIPYAGAIIGGVLSIGLALVQFGDLLNVGIIAGIFVAGQVIEGNVLQPVLVGDRVGLHPVWIIFALFAGGTLMGFVGLLLAVPVAAVIGVLGRFAIQRYVASTYYTGAGGRPPHDE